MIFFLDLKKLLRISRKIHSFYCYFRFVTTKLVLLIDFLLFHAEEVGRVIRGDLLISKDWSRAKQLQRKGDTTAKLMEEKKKIIWNFLPQNKTTDNTDQVKYIVTFWIILNFNSNFYNFFYFHDQAKTYY